MILASTYLRLASICILTISQQVARESLPSHLLRDLDSPRSSIRFMFHVSTRDLMVANLSPVDDFSSHRFLFHKLNYKMIITKICSNDYPLLRTCSASKAFGVANQQCTYLFIYLKYQFNYLSIQDFWGQSDHLRQRSSVREI